MSNGKDRLDSVIDEVLAEGKRPDHIDPGEVPYLQVVADQLDQVPQLEAQAQQLLAQVQAIRGASDSYLLYLFGKYGYDPATTILERDGRLIVREA